MSSSDDSNLNILKQLGLLSDVSFFGLHPQMVPFPHFRPLELDIVFFLPFSYMQTKRSQKLQV